jgi:hypothetical protein
MKILFLMPPSTFFVQVKNTVSTQPKSPSAHVAMVNGSSATTVLHSDKADNALAALTAVPQQSYLTGKRHEHP